MSEFSRLSRPQLTGADLLLWCQGEIEGAWNDARDDTVVHRLAAEHPELAHELYAFFTLVIDAEVDVDRARPDLAEMDQKAWAMLEARGLTGATRPRTFLGLFRDEDAGRLQRLADDMGVTPDFLLDISDNGRVVPYKAREELVRRLSAARKINEQVVLGSFDVVSYRRAASRAGAFPPYDATYEKLIKRSGLTEEQKKFWLTLA